MRLLIGTENSSSASRRRRRRRTCAWWSPAARGSGRSRAPRRSGGGATVPWRVKAASIAGGTHTSDGTIAYRAGGLLEVWRGHRSTALRAHHRRICPRPTLGSVARITDRRAARSRQQFTCTVVANTSNDAAALRWSVLAAFRHKINRKPRACARELTSAASFANGVN